ncbi:MAG TPA: hypothetical protein VF322_03885 [Gammaproteobacteria bacterium]
MDDSLMEPAWDDPEIVELPEQPPAPAKAEPAVQLEEHPEASRLEPRGGETREVSATVTYRPADDDVRVGSLGPGGFTERPAREHVSFPDARVTQRMSRRRGPSPIERFVGIRFRH